MQRTIPLRYYQREAIDAIKNCYYNHNRRWLVLGMPTGSGKTRTMIALIDEMLHPSERALFLVPFIDLVEQTRDAFLAFYPTQQVGVVQAETNEMGRWITIASKDTLDEPGRLQALLDAQGGAPFAIIIVDESHRSVTQGYQDLLARVSDPYSLVVGPSATYYREDRQSLLKVYKDGLAYTKDMFELILEGWLANPVIHNVPTNLDLSDLQVEGGIITSLDHISEGLQKKLVASNRYERTYAYWHKVARERPTAIFAQNTGDAYGFERYFTEKGVPCVFINNRTPLARRKELYDALTHNKVVLVFFNVGTTGLDIPQMSCIILARNTENKGLIHQIIGRGMRTCQETGKEDCLVINVTDKHHTLCTFDFLIGRTDEVISVRDALREQVGQQQPVKKREDDERETPYEISMRVKALQGTVYNAFTGNGWEGNILEGTYTKQCGQYGTLVAEGDLTGWHVYHIAPSSGRRLRLSKEPLEFNHARYRGQKHIESMKERERMEQGTSARLKLGITEGQMRYVTNRRVLIVPRDAPLTQADYIDLKKLLEQYGNAFPRIEGVPHRVAHIRGKNMLLPTTTVAAATTHHIPEEKHAS